MVHLLKPRMYVILRRDDPQPAFPWLPPDCPSRCFEVPTNPRPLVPCEIMTQEEVDDLRATFQTEIFIGLHENGYDAKDIRQVELAIAHPKTTAEERTQWIDENGEISLRRYNQWREHRRPNGPIINPRMVPIEDFRALQDRIKEIEDVLRKTGLKK